MSVVATIWKGYIHKDGNDLYWDIFRAIYEPISIKIVTKSAPWSRAMKMVAKYHNYSAIVGEYRNSEEHVIFPFPP
jgi:polar amino acid transport system substrate-binding protein